MSAELLVAYAPFVVLLAFFFFFLFS